MATTTATTPRARTAMSVRLNTVNRKNPQPGCPDSDLDGVTDPLDAFPDDPFQWADADDGYGDNTNVPSGDDCVDVFGKSFKRDVKAVLTLTLTNADVDDAFPEDQEQWSDSDETDGATITTGRTPRLPTRKTSPFPDPREQRGDAFLRSPLNGRTLMAMVGATTSAVQTVLTTSHCEPLSGTTLTVMATATMPSQGPTNPMPVRRSLEPQRRTMNSGAPMPITTASPTTQTRVRGTPMFPKAPKHGQLRHHFRPQPPVKR